VPLSVCVFVFISCVCVSNSLFVCVCLSVILLHDYGGGEKIFLGHRLVVSAVILGKFRQDLLALVDPGARRYNISPSVGQIGISARLRQQSQPQI